MSQYAVGAWSCHAGRASPHSRSLKIPTLESRYPIDMREYDDKSMTPGAPYRASYYAQLR
jgi:hypothetical protein